MSLETELEWGEQVDTRAVESEEARAYRARETQQEIQRKEKATTTPFHVDSGLYVGTVRLNPRSTPLIVHPPDTRFRGGQGGRFLEGI